MHLNILCNSINFTVLKSLPELSNLLQSRPVIYGSSFTIILEISFFPVGPSASWIPHCLLFLIYNLFIVGAHPLVVSQKGRPCTPENVFVSTT